MSSKTTRQGKRRTYPCPSAGAEALSIIKFHSRSMTALHCLAPPRHLRVILLVDDTNCPGENKSREKVDVLAGIGMDGQKQEGPVQQSKLPVTASCVLLPLGEVHVPFPPGSGNEDRSYYSCLGRMIENDHIYPVPGFDPTTQKQVLCAIWRPKLGTFKYVLDTMPQETPDQPKVKQWMRFCLEEIVDVDRCQLYFASK
jgi:hypothetical protein